MAKDIIFCLFPAKLFYNNANYVVILINNFESKNYTITV